MLRTDLILIIYYKAFHNMTLFSYFFSDMGDVSIFLGNDKNTFFLIPDRVNWLLFFLVLSRSLIFLKYCYFSRPGKMAKPTFGIFLVSR